MARQWHVKNRIGGACGFDDYERSTGVMIGEGAVGLCNVSVMQKCADPQGGGIRMLSLTDCRLPLLLKRRISARDRERRKWPSGESWLEWLSANTGLVLRGQGVQKGVPWWHFLDKRKQEACPCGKCHGEFLSV